jgi:hypothetical protein
MDESISPIRLGGFCFELGRSISLLLETIPDKCVVLRASRSLDSGVLKYECTTSGIKERALKMDTRTAEVIISSKKNAVDERQAEDAAKERRMDLMLFCKRCFENVGIFFLWR